jgi:hypothetical protein
MKRWAGLSGNLLTIEVSYTLLASVVIGAVIGGLTGKLVETSSECVENWWQYWFETPRALKSSPTHKSSPAFPR